MEFKETSSFTRRVIKLLADEEYRALQNDLAENPDAGKLIPRGKGLRKLRWAAKGKGKSGGARVIYYWFKSACQIYMMFIFAKNEQDNLTADELDELVAILEED